MARLDEAEDSDAAFFELVFERARERDPELPDLLRLAAIPRTLNVEVVGVLRARPEDAEGNRRLFESLADYPFALPHPDGGLVYHDNTRDALLAEWQSTDEKRERFVEVNDDLAELYEAHYRLSRESDRLFAEVSTLIAQSNPGRLRRLASVIETNLAARMLESIYHRLLPNARTGYDFFQSAFFELEAAQRFAACRSLVSFTRNFLQRLPPDETEPALLAWLDYFDVRLERASPTYEPARVEETLRRLLERDDLPEDLHTWALDDLAHVYAAQLKIDDALRTRRVAVEEKAGVDPFNDPLREYTLGSLQSWLGDYTEAAVHLLKAIERAEESSEARTDIGVVSRLELSGIHSELGDWDAAFEEAIEAFYLARTTFVNDHGIQQQVASRLASLLATFDIGASDCASAEALALAAGPDDRRSLLVDRVDLLLQRGRIGEARELVQELAAAAEADQHDSPHRLDVLLREARVAELDDRGPDAESAYSDLLERLAARRASGTELLRINALTNRGSVRAGLRDFEGGLADLATARDAWLRHGCAVEAVGARLRLADARLDADDVRGAEEEVEQADRELAPWLSIHRLNFLATRGGIQARRDRTASAEEDFEAALALADKRRDLERQAFLLRKLADGSNRFEQRLRAVDGQARRTDEYRPNDEQRESYVRNARGVRDLCDPDSDRQSMLVRARQSFAAASELDPANRWPLLNLSFAYAEQQDWRGASEALDSVLDAAPAPMQTRRLRRCLHEYLQEYARVELAGDPARAAAIARAALDRSPHELGVDEASSVQTLLFVALAAAGEFQAARQACGAAVAFVADADRFAESVAELVHSVERCWAVDDVLQAVHDELGEQEPTRRTISEARRALLERLESILGLPPDAADADLPIVTPMVVEVGDDLVPIVDSSQDGGNFLYELIPAMRERIAATTGVTVPGVRMRASYLPQEEYTIMVDEVPILRGRVPLRATFFVRPCDPDDEAALADELVDFHPLTGEAGLWAVVQDERSGREDGVGAAVLRDASYLIYRIELAIRAHLRAFLGPEEVAAMIETWRSEDDVLVSAILPDEDACLRLTWLLQRLADDRIPLLQWRELLSAIEDAGGIEQDTRRLHREARIRLLALSSPQLQRRIVHVPPEYEEGLVEPEEAAQLPLRDAGHEFMRWLRETILAYGPGITLLTRTSDGRERVNSLAQNEGSRLIATVSADEVEA